MDLEPPPGYIAGVGRGATGFSTRGQKHDNAAARTRVPKRYLNEEADAEGEDEDVFAAIDERLNNRRKKKKEKEKENIAASKFQDLKQNLNKISEEQWLNLPEAADTTRKNRRQRLEEQLHRRTFAAPDTLIKNKGVDLSKLTEERERILARQIDTDFFDVNDNADTTSKYLNEIDNERPLLHIEDYEDVQKRRLILQSYRRTEPKDPASWISSARLEENCGNYSLARSLIQQGCLECPRDEEIWLENIRLNETDIIQRRMLVANAIHFLPKSSALWLKAIEFEGERSNKYRVVRKALKEIPYCLQLWKLAVKFEQDKSEVVRILKKALEFLPDCQDFWVALIDLAPYSEVKVLLDNMVRENASEKTSYIFIAQLEEKNRTTITLAELKNILKPGFAKSNMTNDEVLKWIDKADSLASIIGDGLTVYAMSDILLESRGNKVLDILSSKVLDAVNSPLVKIAMYKSLLKFGEGKLKLWTELKNLCVSLGKMSLFFDIFEELLYSYSSHSSLLERQPHLSLLYAKELWKHFKSPEKVLEVLNKTLLAQPFFIEGWFAKLKIVVQMGNNNEAEQIFERLLQYVQASNLKSLENERVTYKYINFLRYTGRDGEALKLLEFQYLEKYPTCYKLHLQVAQIHESLQHYDKVVQDFERATALLPRCSILWTEYSKFVELRENNVMRARSILDLGLSKSPESTSIRKARIELEIRQNNFTQVDLLISQGIQQFRKNEWFWALAMRAAKGKKSVHKKTLFQDALKATDNSYLILYEIGRSFYFDNQYAVALKWFERSLSKYTKFGDVWLYKALCLHRMKKDIKICLDSVLEEEPRYGEEWIKMSKQISNIYKPPLEIFQMLLKEEGI